MTNKVLTFFLLTFTTSVFQSLLVALTVSSISFELRLQLKQSIYSGEGIIDWSWIQLLNIEISQGCLLLGSFNVKDCV